MTTNTVPQERPSRARTLLALVSMLDQLPAPEEIGFLESHPDVLNIQLASAADWDAWVKHFAAHVYGNRELYENTLQCDASADWLSWSVSLVVCTSNRGEERLTAEEAASVGGMYLPDDSSEAPSTARHAARDYYAEDPADARDGGALADRVLESTSYGKPKRWPTIEEIQANHAALNLMGNAEGVA